MSQASNQDYVISARAIARDLKNRFTRFFAATHAGVDGKRVAKASNDASVWCTEELFEPVSIRTS